MDTTKEELAQEQMDQLKEALKEYTVSKVEVDNLGAISGSYGYDTTMGGADTISLSGIYNNTVIGGGYTVTTGLGSNATPYYTAGSTSGLNWGAGTGISNTAGPTWSNTHMAGKLNLDGDEADIVINGVSLMDILRDRLNVMIPNPKLEKEWDQLKELGDQYRALEAKLKEQGEMWSKLKQMPPPDLY